MNKKAYFSIVSFIILISIIYNCSTGRIEISALSKYGSTGSEVVQIQEKLHSLGYYSGNIDGIYGTGTKTAVKNFQKDKGLTADGIAGTKTLLALGIGGTESTNGYTESELNLLARFISAESRGEVYEGQVAVGAVILNRVEHPSFPNTISGVLYQPGAFSCLTDGQIHSEIYDSAYKAARDALNGWDPTGGAIYYYNPAKTSNKFMWSRPVLVTIGNHKFCS